MRTALFVVFLVGCAGVTEALAPTHQSERAVHQDELAGTKEEAYPRPSHRPFYLGEYEVALSQSPVDGRFPRVQVINYLDYDFWASLHTRRAVAAPPLLE